MKKCCPLKLRNLSPLFSKMSLKWTILFKPSVPRVATEDSKRHEVTLFRTIGIKIRTVTRVQQKGGASSGGGGENWDFSDPLRAGNSESKRCMCTYVLDPLTPNPYLMVGCLWSQVEHQKEHSLVLNAKLTEKSKCYRRTTTSFICNLANFV